MIETLELYRAAAKAIGHKQLADALNISLGHTYVLTADPLAIDAPVRNDIERLTTLIQALATHPNARPTLILFRLYFKELFARVLDREEPTPLTPETVCAETQEAIGQFGELLRECRPGFIPDRIAAEAADVISILERLVASAESSDDNAVRIRRAK